MVKFVRENVRILRKVIRDLEESYSIRSDLPSVSYNAALATVSTRSLLRASEILRRQATSLLPKDLVAMFLQKEGFRQCDFRRKNQKRTVDILV